jgi:hypothetical protein
MAACARSGTSYSACTRSAAPAIAVATSPSERATTPDRSAAARNSRTMSSVERRAFGPSSQRTSSAARPRVAVQVSSATTATASSSRTTWRTPAIALARLSSTLASRPPNTGQAATAATFMPGSRTSQPNGAEPSTLAGVSSRFAGVPISVKSFGSLSVTPPGTGRRAAAATRAP